MASRLRNAKDEISEESPNSAPPPESPSARALAEIAELRALSRELLRLVYELDEYAARIRQSLAAEAELQSSLRSRPRNEMRTAEKVH
jgi:hypothetical protein